MGPATLTREVLCSEYEVGKKLGAGADGTVMQYKHKTSDHAIAIKFNTDCHNSPELLEALKREIAVMEKLEHENVLALLGWDELTFGPTLYLEHCDMGDLHDYRKKLVEANVAVPEMTVWKLMVDMTHALQHLQMELSAVWIHQDLKPTNILVCAPRPANGADEVPFLPTFKLADFARTYEYDEHHPRHTWKGTYEFMPRQQERRAGITPLSDVFSLGATIQNFALGVLPIISQRTFKTKYKERYGIDLDKSKPGGRPVNLEDETWRAQMPVMYRPLDATHRDLVRHWDFPPAVGPQRYSDLLNRWYSLNIEEFAERRIEVPKLVERFVPTANRRITSLQTQKKLETDDKQLEHIRHRKQQGKKLVPRSRSQPVLGDRESYGIVFSGQRKHEQEKPESRPKYRREDFGLRPRPQRRHEPATSAEARDFDKKEQAYLRGMRKK